MLRDLIRDGRIDSETHPIIRSLGTFVVILVFELFIAGFHAGFDMGSADIITIATSLLGADAASVQGIPWTVFFVAGIWIVAGALLAVWLSMQIGRQEDKSTGRHIAGSASWGIAGGMIIAPAVIGLYILAGRTLVALRLFATSAHTFTAGYQESTNKIWSWVPQLYVLFHFPIWMLQRVSGQSSLIFWSCYLGMILVLFLILVWQGGETNRSNSNGLILNVFIFGLIYCILIPIVQSVWAVLQQLAKNKSWHDILGAIYLGAVVWAVPGLLLGGLVPLLKRAGRNPQSWAFIGYGAAALLIVARILIGVRWPIIPAVLALISGLLFQRGMPVKQFWPFAALSVALGVSGAMSVWQEFTFSGVLIRLHRIDELHPKPPEAPPIPASALYSLTSVQIGQAIRTYASQHPAARPKAPETDNDLTKLDQNAKLLELAISGSVGFWITVGLLACWSMYEREHELPSEFQ